MCCALIIFIFLLLWWMIIKFFLICNPLEQFSIFSFKSCFTSNFVNIIMIHFFIIIFFFYFVSWSVLIKNIFNFIFLKIFELMKISYLRNTKIKVVIYFPIFFFTFVVILFNNLMGLVPYTYAVTSSLIFNFYIIFVIFIMINLVGIIYHKWNFFNIFMPKNVPLIFTWFLIFFETISYFTRIFSLTIRLFANILSGHILQHILITFVFKIFFLNNRFAFFFILPWVITFLVTCLELAICFLQAYVLITLLLIYFGNTIHLH